MGHYDDHYHHEQIRRDQQMIDSGHVEIPGRLQRYFNQQRWIHQDDLALLRKWLNDCPFCKLRDAE